MQPGSLISPDRNISIQLLRALAAIEVMLWHSDLVTKGFSAFSIQESQYTFFGGIGVEVFFVVSGYLMALIAASGITPRKFARSRAARIYPLYWFFTSLVIFATFVNPNWVLGGSLARSSIFASYLILPQERFPTLMVGWTLEFEVLFYVMVAILLLMARDPNRSRSRIVFAFVLAVLGLLGVAIPEAAKSSPLGTHLLTPYMFAFGFGWLVQVLADRGRDRVVELAAVFLGIFAAAWALAADTNLHLVQRIAIAGSLFVAFLALRERLEATGVTGRALAYVGETSYSLYLSHWFILSIFGKLLGTLNLPASFDLPARLVGGLAAIAFAIAIFRFIERPLDRRLRGGRSASFGSRPATQSLG